MSGLGLKVAGIALALVLAVGLALIVASRYATENYKHVLVHLYNVNDISTVSVDCRVAGTVTLGHSASVDLGWLRTTDHVYISTFNRGHGASWGYGLDIDGARIAGASRGGSYAAGIQASEQSVVMAKGFEASGKSLGTVGCAGPLIVSPRLVEYSRVPEASPIGQRPLPHWQPRTFPFALLDDLGPWMPLILACLGVVAGATRKEMRDFIRERWEWSFVMALVALFVTVGFSLGWGFVLSLVETAGTVLIPLTAFLCLREGLLASASKETGTRL